MTATGQTQRMGTGKRIREHRIQQGLTIEQLSERSGVDVGTISALEIRDSSRSKFFPQIAAGLGLSIESLVAPSQGQPPTTSGVSLAPPPRAVLHNKEECLIIEAFRSGDDRTRRLMLFTARETLEAFRERTGTNKTQ